MTIKEFKEKLSRYEDSREISMLDIVGESEHMEEKSMTIKELKEFIKDLPDETKVLNNLSEENEEVDLIYKKSTAYSDVLLIN